MTLSERTARYLGSTPNVDPSAFTAPGAAIVGDVHLGENASVWFQAVLRGDINRIVIGSGSNIQDGSVVHVADDFGVNVGEFVTVGHKAILHACTVADEVLIGMGSMLLDGVEIGARSIVGAGALITRGKKIPSGSLVLGSPAKVVRSLTLDEQMEIRGMAEKYVALAKVYKDAQ